MADNLKKELCKLGGTRIPSRLKIEDESDFIRISLNGKKLQKNNMQESGNDFEGWAIATYICAQKLGINKQIVLDIDEKNRFDYKGYKKNGHLGRFLYRSLKFSEQYKEWFGLSPYLAEHVREFERFLKENRGNLFNNVGNDAAGDKNKYVDENAIEGKLAEKGALKSVIDSISIGDNDVHRQLPVGLFVDKVKTDNTIFTGGKSAIDLWTRKNDELYVVELKTNNIMMGIITEVFFYSNYMLDLVSEDGFFTMNDQLKKNKDHRGYEELLNNKICKVHGIMLADDNKFHPWVNDECLRIMNDNHNSNLDYYRDSYHYDVYLTKVK